MTTWMLSLLICVRVSIGIIVFSSVSVLVPTQRTMTMTSTSNAMKLLRQKRIKRRRLMGISEFDDPRTVIVKKDGEILGPSNSLYVIPETRLDESKYLRPAIVQSRPPGFDHQGLVVDVLSVGSRTRPEYMIAQAKTWASHVHVRNFWGINEEQDYDPQCDQTMDKDALLSYIQFCRGDMGWQNNELEIFRRRNFGLHGTTLRDNAGWFCAQRRPGHGLGWLMEMYRNDSNIPDVLMIVDDDTSVDLENMKRSMQQHLTYAKGRPFFGAGCVYDKNLGFGFAFGGYGTFLNRAAIHLLTQPIFCDDDSMQHNIENSFYELSCASLRRDTIGELDVFRNGDSALDLFYKYSATRNFCLHSDWALGYMLTHYLHENLQQLEPRRCKRAACDKDSVTCHNHGPKEMESFVRTHLSFS